MSDTPGENLPTNVTQPPLPIEIPDLGVREELRLSLRYDPSGTLDFVNMAYEPVAVTYRRVVTIKTDLV